MFLPTSVTVALRSVTELHSAFYGPSCLLFHQKPVHITICLWQKGSAFQELLSEPGKTKIPSFLLPLFHPTSPIHQPCTATCHWPLPRPIFSLPFEVAHVRQCWAAPRFEPDCTTLSSTNHAETWLFQSPGRLGGGWRESAFIGGQCTGTVFDKCYCVPIWLQNHWSRNAGCKDWLGGKKAADQITGIVFGFDVVLISFDTMSLVLSFKKQNPFLLCISTSWTESAPMYKSLAFPVIRSFLCTRIAGISDYG